MSSEGSYDVAIVGGGITGLAHAWAAARRNLRVVLLERSQVAEGASVRNFGMIWPIGQPAGELYELALRSRSRWLELDAAGVVEAEACGSFHLAHHPDELVVLEQFTAQGTHQVEMRSSDHVASAAPLANPSGLLGGMWSPTELRIDPRTASRKIASWLAVKHGVACVFGTPITRIEENRLEAPDGRAWRADSIIICSGSDLNTLFPEELRKADLRLCKLQMLRTVSQSTVSQSTPPNNLQPHIASGLTLRHYTAFSSCEGLAALRTRIASETPELDQYGIHVMASPRLAGDVILGDSHEYGQAIEPFDKSLIDELILRELRKVIRLADWTIAERWHGIYAKHASLPVVEGEAPGGVRTFVGVGGAGMTMSFGLADRAWDRWA